MSAQPTTPAVAPDLVSIEINGQPVQIRKGGMIIEAADKVGIAIPRFCYHDKLPIAANCRMCLVDVEKMPKPQPACATPVMEGMKVFTQSKRAVDAQRNVMEFLLINHPLDCPICDQGGECELQDVAMGYGRSVSRYSERKRVVDDEDLGPLIATDMTRCIHCTRCVRFLDTIAGTNELGGMGRGEKTEISTYIGKSIESELSGNIIDVCPVGALTNKPFRFKARAWELIAKPSIGTHDALGGNLWLHLRRGEVLRTVPRNHEALNEAWASDRDRYAFEGLNSADRALKPMVRRDGALVETDWDTALNVAARGLENALRAHGPNAIGVLASPRTSNEEALLLKQIADGLRTPNVDHRLRQIAPVDAELVLAPAELEHAPVIVLIGSHLRHEMPLLNHRVRKAQRRGAKVFAINPIDVDFNFDLAGKRIVAPSRMPSALAAVLASLGGEALSADDSERHAALDALATALKGAEQALIVIGEIALHSADAPSIVALARALSERTTARLRVLPDGANAVGLRRLGLMPSQGGAPASALITATKALLLHRVEPAFDLAAGDVAVDALAQAECVVALSAYRSADLERCATVLLPIAELAESEFSYDAIDGSTQSFAAAAKAPGDAKSAWRVLRVLAELLKFDGARFDDVASVRAACATIATPPPEQTITGLRRAVDSARLERIAEVPMFSGDSVLRRATALSESIHAEPVATVRLHPEDALKLGLSDGASANVSDGSARVTLVVEIDRRIARGAARIPLATAGATMLKPDAWLEVSRA
jgi:NADH-quinone oxidoreductase subunit G